MRPKTPRDKTYLRRVAALPCMNCGIEGYSQAAHANTGKGMGIKSSDYDTFPLCCARPGIRGCHMSHDQGGLIPKDVRKEVERDWVFRTRLILNH